ncbi:MAG: hypothetical protein OXJ55_09960 [Caldilineaceae bacterium]|nr:hypothetical protein [Caldilineaceae bacterium]
MAVKSPLSPSKERLQKLLDVNFDARRYFFHKADERWLDWLWRNGFLNVLEEEDPSLDGFRTPELDYLLRMAEKCPAQVVDIMLATPISTDMRSQEVVYGFLRICRALPADQLARVIDKIRAEQWVPLLDEIFNHSGFAYEEMLSTLAGAKDFGSFLLLAEIVLNVRPEEEIGNASLYRESPFYLENLARSKLFEQLAAVAPEFAERALVLATSKLAEIIAASDQFLLLEVDFFTLEPGQTDGWQDDVRELAAAAKTLAVRLIGERCVEPGEIKRIYREYLASLPDSRVMRRYRLFVLNLCPEIFKDELKSALFQLLEVERYLEIVSGPEYEKALQTGFSMLSEDEKQDFVQRIIQRFSQPHEYRKFKGSHILSMLPPYIDENPALKKQVEEAGFQPGPDYKPQPSIIWGDGELKTITPKGPISQREIGELPVFEIAGKLRHAWTPTDLHAQNSEADLYNPLNAEGVGDLLKNDIPGRLREYVENAGLFFARGALDQHYTYSFLMGVREAIKKDRAAASEVDWGGVIDLLTRIRDSGAKEPFEGGQRETGWYDFWLANWDAVHTAIADVLREMLSDRDGLTPIDFGRYRAQILAITGYLLSCPDPFPAAEQGETSSSGDRDYSVNQLHSLAINSMRGRAFEAFVQFFLQDRRKFRSDDGIQIFDEVKSLYERVLRKENSRALMFLYGYYLPFFYFSDRDWIRELLPRIFPQEPAREHLYTAAWGGFLARGLYEEMFFDPEIQTLYRRGLELPDAADSPQRQNYGEPGARLAQHLALAYMHYEEFGLDHPLLAAFWKNDSPTQHAHFVKDIGRSFISRDISEESFEFSRDVKSRIRELWDWLLQKDEEREIYMEFGLWINLDKGIFEPVWLAKRVRETLERANGFLTWDEGLVKASPELAQAAPEYTLEIARLYLHEGAVRGKNQQVLWLWDSGNEWIEALEILYRNPSTKVETEGLINRLVGEGGRAFWPLKPILVESA